MNYSMWMLYDKLRAYDPIANIKSDQLRINSLRVMSMQENPIEDTSRLFVWLENAGNDPYAAQGTIRLLNGEDTITLPDLTDTSQAINDLLEAINYFHKWEARLHRAVKEKSPQALIDLATELLGNPMVLADMGGKILAMSGAYISEDINPAWVECREEKRLPLSIIGMPGLFSGEALKDCTDVATTATLPNGIRVLRTYFGNGRTFSGGIGAWEVKRDFLPSDPAVMELIGEAAADILSGVDGEPPLHSWPNILSDLLSGNAVDEAILRPMERHRPGPWRLALIHNPFYTASQSVALKSYLMTRLQENPLRQVTLMYDDEVLALIHLDDVEKLLNQCVRQDGQQYYISCLSQPFDNLRDIRAHYRQARFLLDIAESQPGTYYGEDYGVQFIVHDTRAKPHRMTHPALETLKAHDAEKNSDLYETLFHFLLNERSTQRTAQALHLHKNSLVYRLNQIRELVNLDLDNPELRLYLLLSYYINADNQSLKAKETD